MRTFAVLCLLALFVVPSSADDNQTPAPIPAAEAASKFTLPEGFHATMFAGEPDIVQPMSFTFDDRGRMWVVECLSYPKWRDDGIGNDRITILEDTDNDGKHDKKTVFYDKGCNFSGIEYGFGGVWVTAIPNLIFIPDRDGDDVPDGPPEIILDGWDMKARHNVVNSPTWGPDGWLYGLNGILSNSFIGAPGTADASRVRMNCGVWRYHPTRKKFEAYAHGTTNPWGIDWDEYGQMFITNCVIKHLFHIVPGGHYDRMFGQDQNPHSYHLMPSIADHLHWAGGHWTISRGGQGLHSDAGGGHAHAGCMVYLGDNFPKEYRNNVFTLNIHGARANRDTLEFDGSTYVAKHAPDFFFANDPWFRGLVIKYGPDGGVYVSDWTDTGECHNYEVADTTNGRIYKIVYGQPKLEAFNLAKKTDLELAQLQWHENDWWVRHARRLLQEHATEQEIEDSATTELWRGFKSHSETKASPAHLRTSLRALWAINLTQPRIDGDVRFSILRSAKHHYAYRDHLWYWLIQHEADQIDDPDSQNRFLDVAPVIARNDSPREMLAIASIIPRLVRKGHHQIALATVKELVTQQVHHDPYLQQMIWYAVESLIDKYRAEIIAILPDVKSPMVRECIARRVTQDQAELPSDEKSLVVKINAKNELLLDGNPVVDDSQVEEFLKEKLLDQKTPDLTVIGHPASDFKVTQRVVEAAKKIGIERPRFLQSSGSDQLLELIRDSERSNWQADVVRGMVIALGGASRLKMPESWTAASWKLVELDDVPIKEIRTLGLIYGDKTLRDHLLAVAASVQEDKEHRTQAIELLVIDRAEALPHLLIKLLDDEAVRPAAIRGLAAFALAETPQQLLKHYPRLTASEKEDVVQTLSERPDWAIELLGAVKSGAIPRKDVSSLVVRQLLTLNKDGIKEKIADIWGEIKPASQQKQQLTEKFKLQLTDDVIARANVKNGHALYTKTCGNCHKLYGQGGAIGPELTGSQRSNLNYLLDNVLDPSAIVPREYQVTVLELESGRVVQGIVVEETNFGLTVQTANERVSIPKDQIESRSGSNVSMMPEGLFDRLNESELRDLIAYLKTKAPPQ